MQPFTLLLRAALPCVGLIACGAGMERVPPGVPPTPESVTKERPGGNAHNPHHAALLRQVNSSFGWRGDKDRQAQFPLPDGNNWTRVRFFYIDHFTGFKYGDDHHALTIAFVFALEPGDEHTSRRCVERFEEVAFPKVRKFGGKVTKRTDHQSKWQDKDLLVRTATGAVSVLFKHYDAALAWTGYPAYPGACMMYGVAIPWDGEEKLANLARDAWIPAFSKFQPLTESPPYRH